jgi:arylsulfatase A-like enzyme
MEDVRLMFDGYDTSLRYVDTHVGYILEALAEQNVLDDTAIIVCADHGEDLGELNIYAGHRMADQCAARLPLIIHWPGITSEENARVERVFHYHFDFAATLIELVGGSVPDNWDGVSFAEAFKRGEESGREYLVSSAGAASFTRSVRFDDYLCIRLYHDGYQCLAGDRLLFDVKNDPHEQYDLSADRPDLVGQAMILLDNWYGRMLHTATHAQDPMWSVIVEGGPQDTRGWLPAYQERLRQTGRAEWADKLAVKYPRELDIEDSALRAKQAVYG